MTTQAEIRALPEPPRVGWPRRLGSAWPAAIAGALAAAVAIAVAELFAGFVRGAPSLVIAIGDLIISLQPPGAKDIFVTLFGTNDKTALNLMIVIGALLIAAVTGVLSRRRPVIGSGVFLAFGAVALVAGLREPLATPTLSAVNAAIATFAGVITLNYLTGIGPRVAGQSRGASGGPPSAASGSMPDWDRRRFLITSAGTLVGAAAVGRYGRLLVDAQHPSGVVSSSRLPAVVQAVAPLRADQSLPTPGLTPLVVPNNAFYRIDTSLLVPQVDAKTWRLTVKGMVDHPLTFTYDQLLAMPLFEQYVTIACVSNNVGDNLVGNALWTGVRLKDVLQMAGVQSGATQIAGRSVDGFTVGFPTAWALDPGREPMIAVGMNRDFLPAEHGFPARLIVPGLYGYVSATKWLGTIELTTREAVDGYWVPLGWAKDAPILTQSRIDTPSSGQGLATGTVSIAGVAWAPDRGVQRVEVAIDDREWQQAQLSRPISNATWVQWTLDWNAAAGRHTIEVRATDGTGDVQTSDHTNPAPDGARGHHRISVNVG